MKLKKGRVHPYVSQISYVVLAYPPMLWNCLWIEVGVLKNSFDGEKLWSFFDYGVWTILATMLGVRLAAVWCCYMVNWGRKDGSDLLVSKGRKACNYVNGFQRAEYQCDWFQVFVGWFMSSLLDVFSVFVAFILLFFLDSV